MRSIGRWRPAYTGDRLLARRMLAGDEQAFELFFEENFPRLYRFALARLNHAHEDAEEVALAALCKAISKIGTYRGEAPLFTWLCTFCRHQIHSVHEQRERAPRRVDLVEDAPEVRAALESFPAASLEGPERALRRRETARLVQVVLDHLPSHYGNALEWKYVEGLSVKEIAARMGMGPKAVESLLTRAREAFRDGFTSLVSGAGGGGPELSPTRSFR